MYISWWVHFLTGLTYVLQQPLTAGLAKTKADITKKTSHSYLSRWSGAREYGEVQSKIVWSMPASLLLLQSYWIEGSKRKIKTSWWWTMSFDIGRRKTFSPYNSKLNQCTITKRKFPPMDDDEMPSSFELWRTQCTMGTNTFWIHIHNVGNPTKDLWGLCAKT